MTKNGIKFDSSKESALLETLGFIVKIVVQKVVETCIRNRNKESKLEELVTPLTEDELADLFRSELERIDKFAGDMKMVD